MSDNTIEHTEPATEEFYRREFSVFNPSGSVGISCNGRGQICGITLDEDALTTDEELAAEIVALAKLARAKYRMNLRLFSLEATAAQGRDPERMDRFYRFTQKLPTPEEYAEMERADAARYAP
jgi:hypothetical protein